VALAGTKFGRSGCHFLCVLFFIGMPASRLLTFATRSFRSVTWAIGYRVCPGLGQCFLSLMKNAGVPFAID
jgi:hypothetical protein